MAKADVVTLVDDLSLSITDSTEVGVIYDEVVRELGFLELMTSTETHALDAGEATVTFEDDAVMALELFTASGGRLDRTTTNAIRSVYGNQWRNLVGTPLAYVKDHEDENVVRLVPVPSAPETVTIVRTDARDDLPVWLELPVALEVLGREMARESDHQDVKFAAASSQLGRILFQLMGVALPGAPGSEER